MHISNHGFRPTPAPCGEKKSPQAEPWPFDLTKIDTCEEAMFAPGADMLVKALVGEDAPVKVTFTSGDQRMEYRQDTHGIEGTINGVPFQVNRSDSGEIAVYKGDTQSGPMEYISVDNGKSIRIQGLAGTVEYSHGLFPGDPGSGILADVQGKFG